MLDVYRTEQKYLIGVEEVFRLKQKVAAVMEIDTHNGHSGYRVRSLYFDTLFDSDFEDKVDGYDNRQKIRLRIYDSKSSTAKLELKEKEGKLQRKRSLLLNRQEAEDMITGDYSFLLQRQEALAHWLYAFISTRCYRPKCIVEYERFAYYVKENDTRVTFDMNLRATESDSRLFSDDLVLYPVCSPAEATMEIKFNGFLFTYIKKVIGTVDKVQVSNSKYCRARKITKRGRR